MELYLLITCNAKIQISVFKIGNSNLKTITSLIKLLSKMLSNPKRGVIANKMLKILAQTSTIHSSPIFKI
jgi:hypothetical protein